MRVKTRKNVSLAIIVILLISYSNEVRASVTYTYDQLGRVTTALYDNGLCIAYAYDANGNRTSQTNTMSSPPESPVWGTGSWGCFHWTAP